MTDNPNVPPTLTQRLSTKMFGRNEMMAKEAYDIAASSGIAAQINAAQINAAQINAPPGAVGSNASRPPITSTTLNLTVELVSNGYVVSTSRNTWEVPERAVCLTLEDIHAEITRAITTLRLDKE